MYGVLSIIDVKKLEYFATNVSQILRYMKIPRGSQTSSEGAFQHGPLMNISLSNRKWVQFTADDDKNKQAGCYAVLQKLTVC